MTSGPGAGVTKVCRSATPRPRRRSLPRVLALHPPVDAPIVRPFSYSGSPFARGLHRGLDLAAPPGAPVMAPCAGVVAFAGAHVMTLRCGRFRVTLLPVRGVRARAGSRILVGERLARVGTGGEH